MSNYEAQGDVEKIPPRRERIPSIEMFTVAGQPRRIVWGLRACPYKPIVSCVGAAPRGRPYRICPSLWLRFAWTGTGACPYSPLIPSRPEGPYRGTRKVERLAPREKASFDTVLTRLLRMRKVGGRRSLS